MAIASTSKPQPAREPAITRTLATATKVFIFSPPRVAGSLTVSTADSNRSHAAVAESSTLPDPHQAHLSEPEQGARTRRVRALRPVLRQLGNRAAAVFQRLQHA